MGGQSGTIDWTIIPAIVEAPEMVSMDMGKDVHIPVEGVLLALPEVIDNDVCEVDFSHPANYTVVVFIRSPIKEALLIRN